MLADAVYVLPIRRLAVMPDDVADLAAYLARVAAVLPVVVADGSPPPVRAAHTAAWGSAARVVPVPVPAPGTNGKVVGVLAALAATTQERVVVADDDVRYDAATLTRAVALLDDASAVVPQNVYDPLPWQARWDTARCLVNRAFGGDYPGTLVFRRSALTTAPTTAVPPTAVPPTAVPPATAPAATTPTAAAAPGYDPRVLFENLELLRTVRAHGGRVLAALDVFVPRRPPGVRAFLDQRVRQAYDSLAQPARLAAELALLPGLAATGAARRRGPGWARLVPAAILATSAIVVAEVGRRRAGGARRFGPTAALWAPAWTAERAVCAWIALGWRVRGGVPYAGTRLRTAAHPLRALRTGGTS